MKFLSLACVALAATTGFVLPAFAEVIDGLDTAAAYPVHGVDCTPCGDSNISSICTLQMKVDLFASKTGYYEIEGCEGVNPTLHLTVNRTYRFDQSDISNWYHLIGFAYEADGAHLSVDELEPGIAPPGTNSDCAATNSCPAPMYFMNGAYQGVYSNNPDLVPLPETPSEDFGLDAAEPRFFHPIGDWESYGTFETYLKFDNADYQSDLFYFCHIHSGMSARIKLLDANGNMVNPNGNTPEIPYEYATISEYDQQCGTFNLTDWQLPHDQCLERYVCGDSEAAKASIFKDCLDSMNCHMMTSMTTMGSNIPALFSHHMIPHHENAINMAKSLLKHGNLQCDAVDAADEENAPVDCEIIPLLRDIINNQNAQILDMENVLKLLGEPQFEACGVDPSIHGLEVGRKMQQDEMATSAGAYDHGIECTPCAGTTGLCEIQMKVDFYTSELGHYIVEGCEGVNPTLLLEVDRTYKFDQSDISNWYHLVGFAYEADGAHVDVDELEPGIPPPGTNSNCADTNSCPAPMYYLNDEYQGIYSNNPDLAVSVARNDSNATDGLSSSADDFGLDAVEPLFFHPLSDWQGYGAFSAHLRFDQAMTQDFFYFCHIHSGMSGRIKLIDAEGNKLSEEDIPEIPYEYDVIQPFDDTCGTFGLEQWQLPHPQCPEYFVCGVQDLSTDMSVGPLSEQTFAKCLDSMNCAMLNGMTTNYGGDNLINGGTDDIVLFMRQMIPHHQNAVNMAKSMLKSNTIICTDPENEDDIGCILDPIARGIINTQNHQIQTMRSILETVGAAEFNDCQIKGPEGTEVLSNTTSSSNIFNDGATETNGSDGEVTSDNSDSESSGSTCAIEEENDDGWCARYISRLAANVTCDCYNFCNGEFIGCLGFGEEPEAELECESFARFGCRDDQPAPEGWSPSGATGIYLWITAVLMIMGSTFGCLMEI